MAKRLAILFLTIFAILVPTEMGCAKELIRQGLLRDGFVLGGVDGSVSGSDGDGWFFKLDSDVNDQRALASKGTGLQLLPSVTLEKITADLRKRSSATYQLWGRVTKYKGKNFIFPIYFLPLSKIEQPQSEAPQEHQESKSQEQKPLETTVIEKDDSEPNINEPNDILAIPQEVMEKLKTRRLEPAKLPDDDTGRETEPIVQPQPTAKKASQTLQQDTILANRTVFLTRQDDGQLVFLLDALGRSAPKISLRLLPCEALELTERRQSAELEQPRFKIAGIVTEYKGNQYLLLQRAAQVYNFGNFAR